MGFFVAIFRFLFLLMFVSVTGLIFIALAVMLGKYELITLVMVILIGALVRPFLEKRKDGLSSLPVIGEAIEIYDDLENYYRYNKPHSLMYYVLYPISGILFYIYKPQQAKQELRVYFNLIKWILLLLLFEGFASYFRVYRYFDISFAMQWLYLELLMVYFLCNFFAIPVVVTALKLYFAQSKKQLIFLVMCCSTVFGLSLYHFLVTFNYDNMLTINIILDQNIADEKKEFKTNLYEQTNMFLRHHLSGTSEYYYQHLFSPQKKQEHLQKLNKAYQEHLTGICSFGENQHFFITTTYQWQELWGIVNLPFRDSLVYFFRYQNHSLQIFSHWEDIPSNKRGFLEKTWNKELFEISTTKMFARTMIDELRKKMQSQKKDTKNENMEKNVYREDQKLGELVYEDFETSLHKTKQLYYNEMQQTEEAWTTFINYLNTYYHFSFSTDVVSFNKKWLDSWQIGDHDIKKIINNFYQQLENYQQIINTTEYMISQYQSNPREDTKENLQQQLITLQHITQEIKTFRTHITNASQYLKEIAPHLTYFAIYSSSLQEFDYEKAIEKKLIDNHHGKSSEVRKDTLMNIYSYLYMILLKLFEISMPLHIFMICYFRFQKTA